MNLVNEFGHSSHARGRQRSLQITSNHNEVDLDIGSMQAHVASFQKEEANESGTLAEVRTYMTLNRTRLISSLSEHPGVPAATISTTWFYLCSVYLLQ